MLLTPEQIKQRLKKLGVPPDKYLGQHFLIDEAVLATIRQEAQSFVRRDDAICEIGPGLGVLTDSLIKFPNQVVAVEKDPVFATQLAQSLGNPPNLEVIQEDILNVISSVSGNSQKVERSRHIVSSPTGAEHPDRGSRSPGILKQVQNDSSEGWVVIANIPYAITSPLLRKLVYLADPPHHILVLVQKEAAERITAKPGDRNRGFLTVELEVMAEARILMDVPKTSFWPQPEVESALLLLTFREKPLVDTAMLPRLLRVATAGFSAKRKQLGNSLAGGLGLTQEKARALLGEAEIDSARRAETLTLDEWGRLAKLAFPD